MMLTRDLISKYIWPLSPLPTSLHPGGTLGGKVACVLFDIYGTLFISGSGDISIAQKTSQQTVKIEKLMYRFGFDKPVHVLVEKLFSEIERDHSEKRGIGIEHPEVEIDDIWMRVLGSDDPDKIRAFAVEYELIANPVYPMPNLEKMLAICKASDILMGIISNAQFFTPCLFDWFFDASPEGLGFDTDLTFFSYRFGHAKPSMFMFDAAAEVLESRRIPVHSTLYIGNDMLNDIYPAKKAGFKTALFAGDARSLRLRPDHPKCQNLSADLIITDLLQVLEHIQQGDKDETPRE
ncbi:MAG: HAD family hydrolase [Deltaproteobacteria bacterium]|nr:HAD family hydrolase [Deltaproteobacteria bacterium]